MITILSSSCKNCMINVGKKWTWRMSIPQYMVLVLKLTPINTVSLNTVFWIPQNQCYPGNPCITKMKYLLQKNEIPITKNEIPLPKNNRIKYLMICTASITFKIGISGRSYNPTITPLVADQKWTLVRFHISYQKSEISWQKMGRILEKNCYKKCSREKVLILKCVLLIKYSQVKTFFRQIQLVWDHP